MSFKRKLTTGAVAAVAASTMVALAAPAPAQAAKRKCGYISCTFYFNKSETSDIKDGLGITAIPVAFIPIAGPITAASMGLNTGAMSIMLNHGYCLKLKIRLGGNHVEQGFYSCP